MRRIIPHPLPDTPERLMEKAGYVRHCVQDGRMCYHRPLNEPVFPRFHSYVSLTRTGMEIDLHFDALDSVSHKGNHDQQWAYEGGRVNEEMHRLYDAMCGNRQPKEVYHPTIESIQLQQELLRKKHPLFDVLFKRM